MRDYESELTAALRLLEIEPLKGLDFGESWRMDPPESYRRCRERGVALTRIFVSREELVSGEAFRAYPTGAALQYQAQSPEDAFAVARSLPAG